MNIIFMRHGQATDNDRGIISDREIYWSVLTDDGIQTVKETAKSLKQKIDRIYVSPFPRTLQTAHFVYENHPEADVVIDNRIREIFHGKFSGQENNEELDQTRVKQVEGDFFIRFGDFGENRFEIENRLCQFLKDVFNNNKKENTVLIVSHGSITSFMKRLLGVKSPHIKTGRAEVFNYVDQTNLNNYYEKLKNIKEGNAKI